MNTHELSGKPASSCIIFFGAILEIYPDVDGYRFVCIKNEEETTNIYKSGGHRSYEEAIKEAKKHCVVSSVTENTKEVVFLLDSQTKEIIAQSRVSIKYFGKINQIPKKLLDSSFKAVSRDPLVEILYELIRADLMEFIKVTINDTDNH